MAYSIALSHVGIYVKDMNRMVDFYSGFLGFAVSDRGPLRGGHGEICFMTRDPREHHQFVLANGRPDNLGFNLLNQLSFRVDSLVTLRELHRGLQDENVKDIDPTSHGNTISVYFKDPEGNEIGIFARDYMKRPSAPAAKPAVWKALSANHIVVTTPDYKKLVAWYNELLAFNQTTDSGRDVCMWFGDSVWLPTQIGQGRKSSADLKTLDHCALTVENYDTPRVVTELKRLKIIPADSKVGSDGQPDYGIYGVDLNNFKVQVCSWLEAVTQDRRRLLRQVERLPRLVGADERKRLRLIDVAGRLHTRIDFEVVEQCSAPCYALGR